MIEITSSNSARKDTRRNAIKNGGRRRVAWPTNAAEAAVDRRIGRVATGLGLRHEEVRGWYIDIFEGFSLLAYRKFRSKWDRRFANIMDKAAARGESFHDAIKQRRPNYDAERSKFERSADGDLKILFAHLREGLLLDTWPRFWVERTGGQIRNAKHVAMARELVDLEGMEDLVNLAKENKYREWYADRFPTIPSAQALEDKWLQSPTLLETGEVYHPGLTTRMIAGHAVLVKCGCWFTVHSGPCHDGGNFQADVRRPHDREKSPGTGGALGDFTKGGA